MDTLLLSYAPHTGLEFPTSINKTIPTGGLIGSPDGSNSLTEVIIDCGKSAVKANQDRLTKQRNAKQRNASTGLSSQGNFQTLGLGPALRVSLVYIWRWLFWMWPCGRDWFLCRYSSQLWLSLPSDVWHKIKISICPNVYRRFLIAMRSPIHKHLLQSQ